MAILLSSAATNMGPALFSRSLSLLRRKKNKVSLMRSCLTMRCSSFRMSLVTMYVHGVVFILLSSDGFCRSSKSSLSMVRKCKRLSSPTQWRAIFYHCHYRCMVVVSSRRSVHQFSAASSYLIQTFRLWNLSFRTSRHHSSGNLILMF